MRNIVSPLDGFLSPFGRRGGIPLLGGIQPTLFLDFSARVYARRELDAQDYRIGGSDPVLVTDFSNNTFGA